MCAAVLNWANSMHAATPCRSTCTAARHPQPGLTRSYSVRLRREVPEAAGLPVADPRAVASEVWLRLRKAAGSAVRPCRPEQLTPGQRFRSATPPGRRSVLQRGQPQGADDGRHHVHDHHPSAPHPPKHGRADVRPPVQRAPPRLDEPARRGVGRPVRTRRARTQALAPACLAWRLFWDWSSERDSVFQTGT